MKTKQLITRRKALVAGLSSAGGLLLSGCSKKAAADLRQHPAHGRQLDVRAHRALLPGQSLAREYSHKDITSFPAIGTTNPGDPNKPKLQRNLSSPAERRICGLASIDRRVWSPGLDPIRSLTSSGSLPGRRSPGTLARKAGPLSVNGRAFH